MLGNLPERESCQFPPGVVCLPWRYPKTAAVCPPSFGGNFFGCPLLYGKGGCPMVTYSDLIQIGILIVGIIGLIIQANNKKK